MTNAAELKWRKAAAEESTTPSTDEIPAKLVALDSESEPMLKMTDALPIKLGVQQITLVMSTSRTVTRDVTRFIIGKTVSVCHFKQSFGIGLLRTTVASRCYGSACHHG